MVLDNINDMEKRRLYFRKHISGAVTCLLGMIVLFLFSNCDKAVIEPIDTVELRSGYSIQLTAPSNMQWGSENPSVATVSSTGLVTAVGAGTTTIYTYSSANDRTIICYLEVFPKRNLLFYIGSDTNGLDNGSSGDEPRAMINAMRAGWKPGMGEMLIYADQTNRPPCLMRINETRTGELYGIDTIHVYSEENSADAAVLSRIIHTVASEYPADSYGMIFFSHASGWLPEGMLNSPRSSETGYSVTEQFYANKEMLSTDPRSLVIDKGDGTSREMKYQDFAAAIPDNQFDFIIFEACFMADVMTMYELRNKTEYILASSAEIVSPGFTPLYKNEVMRLFDTKIPVQLVASDFGQIYVDYLKSSYPENNVYCSTTMGLINMSEMQNLATTVKTALNDVKLNESTLQVDNIQRFDRPNKLIGSGQRRNRYFDLGHVMEHLVSSSQYAAFQEQMEKTVVWKDNTKRFLLANYGNGEPYFSEYDGFFIEHHSGLSTYIEQAVYPQLNSAYINSAWYKAIYQ